MTTGSSGGGSRTQLTDDGEAKRIYDNLLTDGSRVYFKEGTIGEFQDREKSRVTAGPTSIISTRFATPDVAGLTREESSLLALVGPDTQPARPDGRSAPHCVSKLRMEALRRTAASSSLKKRTFTP